MDPKRENNEDFSEDSVSPSLDVPIDVKDLTWDSPSDSDDPKNFPVWKKAVITVTAGAICLTGTLGSSLYAAGLDSMLVELNTSRELGFLGFTTYLLGFAWGPGIAAPISESIGRKPIFLVSIPLAILFTMGVGLSQNIQSVIVFRFFSGFFASPAMAVAAGTMSDIYALHQIVVGVSFFCIAPFLGPVLGPVIGGFVAYYKDWRWVQWVTIMGLGITLPFAIYIPETYRFAILRKRAIKRGVNVEKLKFDKAYLKKLGLVSLVRPLEMLAFEPVVLSLSIYIAFLFAVLYGFFEAYPVIFGGIYGMAEDIRGLPFIGVNVGLVSGTISFAAYDRLVVFKKNPDGTRGPKDENGNNIRPDPERYLVPAKIGAICLPIALFWLGWTSKKSIHWIAPTLAGIPFGWGLINIFLSCIIYFSMSFPAESVSSASAANNLLRYAFASSFPLFCTQMYENIGVGWASSTFAFVSLLMGPVPWILTKYGPRLRSKSRFGFAAIEKMRKEMAESQTV